MTADPDDFSDELTDRWEAYQEDGGVSPDIELHGPIGDPTVNCPVVCLGMRDGISYFLDSRGEFRNLTVRQLGTRSEQQALCLGNEDWQRRHFPRFAPRKIRGELKLVIVGYSVPAVAAWLMQQCGAHPIFGSRIRLRRPGVWPGEDGRPIVHCGDEILINGEWVASGVRIGDVIWIADEPAPRPGTPADARVAAYIVKRMGELWRYRYTGGPIVCLGVIGSALLGAVARWRPNVFIGGSTGAGKTKKLELLRAMCPQHNYTTDTTRAGLEQSVTGRAVTSFVDEAADQVDQRGAQTLLSLTLSSTGEEGAKVARGTADGVGRSLSILGSFVFASTAPPDMQPQHLARVALVELLAPEGGADHLSQMDDLIVYAREQGPQLWARVLAKAAMHPIALARFRDALGRSGCAPRQMDQLGAILAGWWILTEDGEPTDRNAIDAVAMISDFVARADEIASQSAGRQVAEHLASFRFEGDRSSEKWPGAELCVNVWRTAHDPETGDRIENADTSWLERAGRCGLRPIRADQVRDYRDRVIPRGGPGDGVWIAYRSAQIVKAFEGTDWPGQRWRHLLVALPSVREASGSVRIGNMNTRAAIWISRADLLGEDDGR